MRQATPPDAAGRPPGGAPGRAEAVLAGSAHSGMTERFAGHGSPVRRACTGAGAISQNQSSGRPVRGRDDRSWLPSVSRRGGEVGPRLGRGGSGK